MRKYSRGSGRTPIRTCVSCGGRFPKVHLIRYVWRQNGPLADDSQTEQGRGGYCCRSEKCTGMFQAQRKRWKRVFRLPERVS